MQPPRHAVHDSQGNPVLLHHGDRPGIEVETGKLPLPPDDGIYFSSNREYALGFTEDMASPPGVAPRPPGWLHTAYVCLRNPFVVENPEEPSNWEKLNYRGFSRSDLQAKGYDGIVARLPATGGEPEEVLVVAFSQDQIVPVGIEKNHGSLEPLSAADSRAQAAAAIGPDPAQEI